MTQTPSLTSQPELIRHMLHGYVDTDGIDAGRPSALCRWLLAHHRLYTLPANVFSADWITALEHFGRTDPDPAAFEDKLKDWQRWPPVDGLLFSDNPDVGFDFGHLLGLAWICSDARRLDEWSQTPERELHFWPGRVLCWACGESVHPDGSPRCVACGWLVCPNGQCGGPYRVGEHGPVGQTCHLNGTLRQPRTHGSTAHSISTSRTTMNASDLPPMDDHELEAAYETWRTFYGDID